MVTCAVVQLRRGGIIYLLDVIIGSMRQLQAY